MRWEEHTQINNKGEVEREMCGSSFENYFAKGILFTFLVILKGHFKRTP